MYCLLELFFKNSDIDANNFLAKRLEISLKQSINFDDIVDGLNINIYATPARVAVYIKVQDLVNYSKKGIKISDKNEHLNHFLNKLNLADSDNLTIRNDRYYYDYKVDAETFLDILYKKLNDILDNSFSKNYKKILLLLRNIYVNISGECKNIIFNNIKSSNCVIVDNKEHLISSADEYFNLLESNNIFLNIEERKNFVKNNLKIFSDEFINNVLFISEKPKFLYGKIKFSCNELFLQLLEKISKDKYVFFIKDEFLYFVFLSDNGKERIDNFDEDIYDEDIINNKYKISKIINKLNNRIFLLTKNKKSKEYKFIFNENRLTRLNKIAKFLSLWISNCNTEEIDSILSSSIYKNSNFLENNTELDLLLKKYFLTTTIKNERLINGIVDSLKPARNSNDMPNIPASIAVAIANKIDTLVYYEILSEIKRQNNKNLEKNSCEDLLNLLIERDVDLPLKIIINYSVKNFINETIAKKQNRLLIKKYKIDKNLLVNDLLEKIYNRLSYRILNKNTATLLFSSEISAIANVKNKCHILKTYKKINIIADNFTNISYLIASYKRMNNLLNINKKFKLLNKAYIILKPKKFHGEYEKNLYDSYFLLKKNIKTLTVREDYKTIVKNLYTASDAINEFLDNVYLNKIGIFKRKRYVRLLFAMKILFNKVIEFNNLI